MHQKKEILDDLLDSVKYYTRIFNEGNPKRSDLVRYYISNWQYNLALIGSSHFRFRKRIYERRAKEYKQKFNSLFPDNQSHIGQ